MITGEVSLFTSITSRHGTIKILELSNGDDIYIAYPTFLEIKSNGVKYDVAMNDDLLGVSPFLHYLDASEYNKIILVNWAGLGLYLLDITEKSSLCITTLNRQQNDDTGFYRLDLLLVEDRLLLIYELGIMLLSVTGEVIWHQQHERYDWIFDKIIDNVIWYSSHSEGIWGYDLRTGERLSNAM